MLQYVMRMLLVFVALMGIFGLGRLYLYETDGFAYPNIVYNLSDEPTWHVASVGTQKQKWLFEVLSQPFTYLGKGCQSYVFESQDGEYVIKFFKFQRIRLKPWQKLLQKIPLLKEHFQEKVAKKQKKLEQYFSAWKLAFEELGQQTAVVYVHLNKTDLFPRHLVIKDKVGMQHLVDLDQVPFLVQKKVKPLCLYIDSLMEEERQKEAFSLLDKVVDLSLWEYHHGYHDLDHALMPNTGVLEGQPVHIDVGLLTKNKEISKPGVHKQELFNHLFRFRIWLHQQHPQLLDHLDRRLHQILGDKLYRMVPTHLPEKHWSYDFSLIPS